jgi:RHS repeat-associated protein
MTYDGARRLLTTAAPPPFNFGSNLVQTTNAYDADGHLTAVTRSNGPTNQVVATSYTRTGQILAVTDANSNPTTRTYDLNDRLQSVTQPVAPGISRLTRYNYDTSNRLVSVIDNTGNIAEQYSYTANGKLATFTDAGGNATSYTYDGFDRLSQITYPIGSTGTHTSESFTYDADDNVSTRTTRAGDTISFSYDTLNRLCTKTISTSAIACTATSSPSPTVWFGHDLAGRVTTTRENSAAITAAVSGTPASYAVNYVYDQLNRPVNVNWNPAPIFTAPSASNVTFNHTYNRANQRISQAVTDNSWFNYPAATPSTVNYTANAANQYTAVGAVSPTYNANGNLTSDGTFTFGYDAENRLTSASGAGNTVAYTYDGRGRRKTKTVNGTTTVFVTDNDNREVLEYDGASGAILRWYAYGLGSNDVLNHMNIAAGTRATLVPDIQGSVIASLDSSSATLSKIGYLPYGKSASAAAPFGYTGQRIDPETNSLYYYRARMYAPAWGRFMQVDPPGTLTDVPQASVTGTGNRTNLYVCVNNDPLNNLDPLGLWTFQLGLSINIQLGVLTLQGSSGFAIDGYGNLAILNVGGGGGGAGGRFSGGISVGTSNADQVGQLSSWFDNASIGIAAGPSASGDAFHGIDESSGRTIVGGGFTVGIGLGGGGSVTRTYTAVTPLNYSSPQQFTPASAQVPISK